MAKLVSIDIIACGRYSTKQASEATGYSPSAIRTFARQGRLPKFFPPRGGRGYYRGSDLIKLWKGEI